MTWFIRSKKGILTPSTAQNDTPSGQWVKCDGCGEILNHRELEDNARVCRKCGHHFQMGSEGYFGLIFDGGEYERHDVDLMSVDPLSFEDRKSYPHRIREARRKTGLTDAARAATGLVDGHPLSVAALDFSFIGGSMGSVVGEIVSRAIRRGYEQQMPVLIIAQSGGARMMEGALSLMQMAKTSAHLSRLAEARQPYISLLTNPTTGGVTASFAMLGDVNIAEPGALIGFAGPRIIRETIGQDLPEDFQRAEFVLEHGFLDHIVDRRNLRSFLIQVLGLLRA